MKLSEFAGYGDKMLQLMRSVQAGRIVHALLFVGPHGSGKRTVARLFAQAMLCQGEREKPCDVCPACKRFLAGLHPDVRILKPEKKTIGIDDDKFDAAMQIIEKVCKSRKQISTSPSPVSGTTGVYVPYPVEVTVGGATIFVLNVDKFVKI